MLKLGKFRAGLFCGSKVLSWRSWKIEGFKFRPGKKNGSLIGIGPFIFWKECSHERLRCVHGGEFMQSERRMTLGTRHGSSVEMARVACADCGLLMYGKPRLLICSDTGFTHTLTRS